MTTTRATRPARPTTTRPTTRRAPGRRPSTRRRPTRRRRITWRPSARLLAWAGGGLGLLLALIVVVVATPVMSVRNVEVTGATGQTAAAVRDLAEVPVGTPLARLDTGAIRQRLGSLPQLASVRVERSWPSTVVLVVTERVALALVDVEGTRWLVDAEGVLFAQVTEAPAGLPVLEVASPGPRDPGTRAALEVLSVLPGTVLDQLARITATSADGVQLVLVGGRKIVWGSAEDSARKAEVLSAVFGRPGRLIDVSSPEAVVLR